MTPTYLTFSLASLLCLASAQGDPGQSGGAQGAKPPEQTKGDSAEQAGRGDGIPGADVTGEGALNDAALGGIGTPVNVQVQQEPYRLSPGQPGTLLLTVRVGPGGHVRSGVANYARTQGPFALGDAVWDPPGSAGVYEGVFLIRIPVTVKAGTDYGKHPIGGALELVGDFRPVELPGKDPSARAPLPAGSRFTKAQPGFSGTLKVGRPIPPMPDLKTLTEGRETGSGAENPAERPETAGSDEGVSADAAKSVAPPKQVLAAEADPGRSLTNDTVDADGDKTFGVYLLAAALLGALGLVFLRRR